MRIRTRWHQTQRTDNQTQAKTLEDIASSLKMTLWQIAGNGVLELENQGYHTQTNQDRLTLIAEYLAFLLQITDRLVYENLSEEDRQRFITALALGITKTFADNQRDLQGSGEYKSAFIDFLNQRGENYAECSFQSDMPGFDFLRYFGEQIAAALPQDNSLWVSQFIMEVEAPAAIDNLKKGLNSLFNQGYST